MTAEEFSENLPRYASDPAKSKPPFIFKNLSVRIFPLRANLDALQQVCDSYLNFVPPGVARFRASIPYAYLALLDYGQIAEMSNSVGWFSQAEVYFGIPVECYQSVQGRWVFRHWAVITPFIYVDDDFSAPLGRSVFGYPKTLARVTSSAGEWLKDSAGPVTLARVETRVFPQEYEGQDLQSRVFLEVERAAPMSNFRVPSDPRGPMTPWMISARLAEAGAGFARDIMRLGQFMRIFEPNPTTNPSIAPAMLNGLIPAFLPGGKGITLNSMNLKQFRSAEHPSHICFQALTNAGLQMMALNGAGLLGEERTGLGDLTGGHTVKLYEYSSLPIVRTLGLEVHKRWRGDGADVALLKPLMPFWANLNVKFLAGETLAWRTGNGIWFGGDGRRIDPLQTPVKPEDESVRFNTAVASAVDDAVTGPFVFDKTTVRVLPLLAKRQVLQEFLDGCINKELEAGGESRTPGHKKKQFRLTVWSRPAIRVDENDEPLGVDHAYVYVTATTFGEVTSETNNVGDWANYELSFLIPVKFESRDLLDRSQDEGWILEGVGLVPAYNFADDSTAAFSRSEVAGIPTIRANFVRPENVWLDEAKNEDGDVQTMLRVSSEVFTALHAGQKALTQPIFEVKSSRDVQKVGKWVSRLAPDAWADLLRNELGAKNATAMRYDDEINDARSLVLEILGNRLPIALYTLKEFRDAADPGKACYQAVVRVSRSFEDILDIREIEQTLRICIHDFPSLQLVKSLGIVAHSSAEYKTGVSFETQPIRPFYIRGKIREERGEELLVRAGGANWIFNESVSAGCLGTKNPLPFHVDGKVRRTQDDGDPCRMHSIMSHTGQWQSGKTRLTVEEKLELQGLRDPRVFSNEIGTAWRNASETAKKNAKARVTKLQQKRHERDRRDRLADLERRRLTELVTAKDAKRAFEVIDPQMVIETILSREWGNADENARWRVERKDLLESRDLLLLNHSGGLIAVKLEDEEFVATALNLKSMNIRKSQGQRAHRFRDHLRGAIREARRLFLDAEEQLFRDAVKEGAQWQRRTGFEREVGPRISQRRELTDARLNIEEEFTILTTWHISQRVGTTVSISPARLKTAAAIVCTGLNSILGTLEDGPFSSVDVEVIADLNRLETMTGELEDYMKYLRDYEKGKKGVEIKIQNLLDKYREAVFLGIKLCGAQRDRLIDKLSRVRQKPDFCVRRDAVDYGRDSLFPRSHSWDNDWYAGEKLVDRFKPRTKKKS